MDKYDGTQDPKIWVTDYLLADQEANGNDWHAVKHLALMLKGSAQAWLNTLAPKSISCLDNLQAEFIANFKGMYVQPADSSDLGHVIQERGKSVHAFWIRFLKKKNKIIDYADVEAISTFKHGLKDEQLTRIMGSTKPKSMMALMDMVTNFASEEDAWTAK